MVLLPQTRGLTIIAAYIYSQVTFRYNHTVPPPDRKYISIQNYHFALPDFNKYQKHVVRYQQRPVNSMNSMNNTTYLVVRSPHSINPSKAEKDMTASLFPIIPVSETAVLYLEVPRLMMKAV
jgi:hypothetical protein